jgi:gamma-glutamylcyclotransferase (GGCT)/AIG2-like uncharacterized protein YtfP
MIKLFSYGTLYQSDIQESEFGQIFYVEPDLDYINGWDLIKVKMDGGEYYVAVESGETSIIMGAIVHIPEKVIEKVDEYETSAYERINIKTLCGNECQMYVKRIDK